MNCKNVQERGWKKPAQEVIDPGVLENVETVIQGKPARQIWELQVLKHDVDEVARMSTLKGSDYVNENGVCL